MRKYYAIATLVILAGLYSYHFLAAEKAEEQIDQSIQQQAATYPGSLNIQYSDIDISPFSGNITFEDLNIIDSTYIGRVQNLTFNLTYWDFLTTYFSGAKSVLNQEDIFRVHAGNISLLQRKELREIKMASLQASYSGNLWKTIGGMMAGTPLQETQDFSLSAASVRYSQPESRVGSFRSDSVFSTIQIMQNADSFRSQSQTTLRAVSWTPPPDFQQNFEFFIKGFGMQPDSIPVREAQLSLDINTARKQLTVNESTLTTDLAKIDISGNADWTNLVWQARVDTLVIRAYELSDQLQNVLDNAEKLFGIRLPKKGNDIVIKLSGTPDSLKVIN